MSKRRPYGHRVKCDHEGCTDYGNYSFDTRRDLIAHLKYEQKSPYRCTRHRRPEEVLSADNQTRETVLTVGVSDGAPGLYWLGNSLVSGFNHGPGFKAYANDFPKGTKLVITARIELPKPAAERKEGA